MTVKIIIVPKIAGILNITPDSFSGDGILAGDSGANKNNINKDLPEFLENRINEMIKEGADIIDIGAESTAPGSKEISLEEEIRRLEPVFKLVKKYKEGLYKKGDNNKKDNGKHNKDIIFSIDTRNAATAKESIKHGFSMVNDVSGGRYDKDMYKVIKESGVKYIMMYCKNTSGKADLEPVNYNVYNRILEFLDNQIEIATKAGIKREQIIVDPGMGAFISPSPEDSLEVLKRIKEIKERYKLPIYIGASRKGFLNKLDIDRILNEIKEIKPLDINLSTSVIAAIIAAKNGADYLRVHDIKETIEALNTHLMK